MTPADITRARALLDQLHAELVDLDRRLAERVNERRDEPTVIESRVGGISLYAHVADGRRGREDRPGCLRSLEMTTRILVGPDGEGQPRPNQEGESAMTGEVAGDEFVGPGTDNPMRLNEHRDRLVVSDSELGPCGVDGGHLGSSSVGDNADQTVGEVGTSEPTGEGTTAGPVEEIASLRLWCSCGAVRKL